MTNIKVMCCDLQYQRELMAKAAGIEIVTAGELKEKYERDSDGEYSEEEENSEETAEYSDEEEDQSEEDDEEYETASDEDKKNTSTSGIYLVLFEVVAINK